MFDNSIDAISNRYLRKEMGACLGPIEKRHSFAAAFQAVSYVPGGMVAAVNTMEIAGRLVPLFDDFAGELKKVVEAKLDVVKFLSTGVAINCGVLIPMLLILPSVLEGETLKVVSFIIAAYSGYVGVCCFYGAIRQYMVKSAEINLWFNQLDNSGLKL